MKRTLMTSVALGAIMMGASITAPATSGFVGPAFAQDAEPTEEILEDDAAPEQGDETEEGGEIIIETEEQPADEDDMTEEDPAMEEDAAEEPTDGEAMDDEAMDEETVEPVEEDVMEEETMTEEPVDEAAEGTERTETFIEMQAEDEVSANTYIGQSLYNLQDESIGNINDLIFTDEGGVNAAIVGVGGFLGIGQKEVAVNFELIEIQQQPDSADVRLVIDATREQLENAPEFVSLDEQMAERRANQPVPGAGTGIGGTAPPPATAPAPAQ